MNLPTADAPEVRVLVAGDTHGNGEWVDTLFEFAVAHGCEAVLQLGDFGYWPHTRDGQLFLKQVESSARRAQTPLVWIDGNHENHTLLRQLPRRDDGFVELSPNVLYAPRGHRWRWASTRCGALGGAFSIDWRRRSPGTSWWAEETIDDVDVDTLGDAPLDVLFTHDAPAGVPLEGLPLPSVDELLSYDNRRRVAHAVNATTPSLLLHGHWHYRYRYELIHFDGRAADAADEEAGRSTQVHGLSSDQERDGGSWGVLELPAIRFRDGTAVQEAVSQ